MMRPFLAVLLLALLAIGGVRALRCYDGMYNPKEPDARPLPKPIDCEASTETAGSTMCYVDRNVDNEDYGCRSLSENTACGTHMRYYDHACCSTDLCNDLAFLASQRPPPSSSSATAAAPVWKQFF